MSLFASTTIAVNGNPSGSSEVETVDPITGWGDCVTHLRDQKVILDFTQSPFIGAKLIGVLASLAGPFEQNGSRLILCGLDGSCARIVLETTPLTEENIARTLSEALGM